MLSQDEQAVLDLEKARCDAISKGDLAALGDCLAHLALPSAPISKRASMAMPQF